MSFTIIAIAAAHALPPIIGAALMKTQKALITGVAIATIIALASGNIAFIIADLIGIGVGYTIGLSIIETNSKDS